MTDHEILELNAENAAAQDYVTFVGAAARTLIALERALAPKAETTSAADGTVDWQRTVESLEEALLLEKARRERVEAAFNLLPERVRDALEQQVVDNDIPF